MLKRGAVSVEEDLGREIIRRIEELDEPTDDKARKIVEELAADPVAESKPPFDGYIESIRVQGIRSFGEEQELELSRGLTIVYAENGTGKTSLVDAVELLTNGKTTRAAQAGSSASEVKDERYVLHSNVQGKSAGIDPRVRINWMENDSLRSSVWGGEWKNGAAEKPPVHLLARRRLREILNAKGVDRAERIVQALGLHELSEKWDAAQEALTKHANAIDASPVSGSERLREAVRAFLSEHDAQNMTRDEITKCIEREARERFEHPAGDRGIENERTDLEVVWCAVVKPPPIVPNPEELAAATEPLRGRERLDQRSGPDVEDSMIRLLEVFKAVAVAGEECPACADGTVTSARLDAIAGALATSRQQRLDREETERRLVAVRGALRKISDCRLEWNLLPWDEDALQLFCGDRQEFRTVYEQLTGDVTRWKALVGKLLDSVRKAERTLSDVDLSSVAVTLQELTNARANVEGRARTAESLRLAALHSRESGESASAKWVVDNAHDVADAVAGRLRNDAVVNAVKAAAARVKDRRGEVLAAKIAELQDGIDSWVQRLAPDHTPPARLEVGSSVARPSLNVAVSGGRISVLGRLSDSQLDMLGLAVHFAALERESPGGPLIIDDPTDMLDIGTVEKFTKDGIGSLLEPDSGTGRQVVVLTHDHRLIRLLWQHHGHRFPCVSQWYIELDRQAGAVPQSRFRPRSTEDYADRLQRLFAEHPDADDQFWLRGAAGNLARQTLEAVVCDLFEVLGPNGLKYLPALERSKKEKGGILGYCGQLEEHLYDIRTMHQKCGEPRHWNAGDFIGEVEKAVATRGQYMLNDASHANHVYPRAAKIQEYQKLLSRIAGRFGHADRKTRVSNAVPDDWPRTSQWSEALGHCGSCNVTEFFPDFTP